VRDALQKTALDLGATGRDTSYGFGLVQAAKANSYLNGTLALDPVLTVTKVKSAGKIFAKLSWTNATMVNIFRGFNTSMTSSYLTNYGGTSYSEQITTAGTYYYKVCTTGSTPLCSNTASQTF
jgi:serine protease